jgi:hypothetical protein
MAELCNPLVGHLLEILERVPRLHLHCGCATSRGRSCGQQQARGGADDAQQGEPHAARSSLTTSFNSATISLTGIARDDGDKGLPLFTVAWLAAHGTHSGAYPRVRHQGGVQNVWVLGGLALPLTALAGVR